MALRSSHGHIPAEVAVLSGCAEVADWLVSKGAPAPSLDGPDALIAAAMCVDRRGVERFGSHAAEARRRRPGLLVWAASRAKPEAVELLLGLGFDVNAFGRSDVPPDQEWETALHVAAALGDVELSGFLLDAGADPRLEDNRFRSTPLGWARHFGQTGTAALLERPRGSGLYGASTDGRRRAR